MNKKYFLFFALLAIMMNSCRKDYLYIDKTPPSPNLSFATDILPLMNYYGCNVSGNCHNGAGGNEPDLTSLNAYNAIKNGIPKVYLDLSNPANSLFYISINDPNFIWGQMPINGAGTLSVAEQERILAWISQGAKP